MTGDARGLVMCAKYAFAPNSLHYCGPEKQKDLFEYVRTGIADEGLSDIIHRFETLYPYLALIASENRIHDPYDYRVVEAYWLGNQLLSGVRTNAFAIHASETLLIAKKVPKHAFTAVMDRVLNGFPHHSHHVLNIYIRTGKAAITHTLSTMDNCRISWGKVISTDPLIVESRRLVFRNKMLALGMPEKTPIIDMDIHPKTGEWVSMHWGYVCDVLTASQRYNLARFTNQAIRVANAQI